MFQFLGPVPSHSPPPRPPAAEKPASSRVNLPKVSALLCPCFLSLSLFRSIKKRKLQLPTTKEKCATACPGDTLPLPHLPPVTPPATLLHFNSVFFPFLPRLVPRGRLFKRISNAVSEKTQTKLAKKYGHSRGRNKSSEREKDRQRERERQGDTLDT